MRVAGQIARCGRAGDGQFALVNGVVGLILHIEDAAEKLVRQSVASIGGESGAKQTGGFVHAALLQGVIGGSVWAKGAFGGCKTCEVRLRTQRAGEEKAQSQRGGEALNQVNK
jgi:hypothetical protein